MSEPASLPTDRHTPGPWSNERIWDTPETRIHARIEGMPMALAEVFSMRNVGEREANARLIAAAPELLAALKAVVEEWDSDQYESRLGRLARATIAKATGEIDV